MKIPLIKIYILLYFAVNLLFLESFPFVHSDEAWLSGLTRSMVAAGSLAQTETFFDLLPRYPHAVKSLFHLLQMLFYFIFGYRLFAFRLISLVFASAALPVFYKAVRTLTGNERLALFTTVLMSLDIQFLYAAHFARQEIIILLAMLGAFYLLLTGKTALAAVVTGLSIGIHPNSFVAASMSGLAMLALHFRSPKALVKNLSQYALITAVFCLSFIMLSLSFDRQFFAHYLAYGAGLGVDTPAAGKMAELIPFLERIFYGVSGTYYLPDIKLQLALFFPATLLLALLNRSPKVHLPLAAVFGILLGTVIIGRYNQTGIVFVFPFFYAAFGCIINSLREQKYRVLPYAACIAVLAAILSSTAYQLHGEISQNAGRYSRYIEEIASAVPKDAKVLGNLNADYYFVPAALKDYRNLAYLAANDMSFEQYVRGNGIEYLILSDELDFIYNRRPNWNSIYGNVYPFYEQMNRFTAESCELVHSFTDNAYGVRIVGYRNSAIDFNVRIYRVLSSQQPE